ncbi:MAG: lipopolysaccharide biosynthesis protein [Syntrophomonas sp.]
MIEDSQHSSLYIDTAKGFKWVAILQFSQQILLLIVNLILARILGPSDFGLVALVTVTIGLLLTIVDLGFNAAIIQKEEINEYQLSTAFFLNLVMGLLLCLLLICLSTSFARFFQKEAIGSMLQFFSLVLIIRAFISVQMALCDRSMDFRKVTLISMLAIIVGAICKLVLAYKGLGVWSIIYGEFLNQFILVIILWIFSTWRPSLRLVNKQSFFELFAFGSNIMLSNLIGSLSGKIDVMMIGKLVSSSQLGIYSMAYNISAVFPQQINAVVQRVMFPSFSRIQADNHLLGDAFCKLSKYLSIIGTPALVGMMMVAPELVNLVLSPKWENTILILQILCLYAVTNVMGGVLWAQVLKAKGYANMVLWMTVIRLTALVAFVYAGSYWGLMGIAVSLTVYGWIFRFVYQHIVNKVIDLSMRRYMFSLIPSIVCTLIMFISLLTLRWIDSIVMVSDIVLFTAMVITGIIFYYGSIRVIFRSDYDEILQAARAIIK